MNYFEELRAPNGSPFTARGGTNPGSHKPRWMINPMQSYTKFMEKPNVKGKNT
jgi:hypothetical protein